MAVMGGYVAVWWQSCDGHVAVMWRSCGGHVAVMWQSCSGHVVVNALDNQYSMCIPLDMICTRLS